MELADGRVVSVLLASYLRLSKCTVKERYQWRLIAEGNGIHRSLFDEDISDENLIFGQPSGESQAFLGGGLNEENPRFRAKESLEIRLPCLALALRRDSVEDPWFRIP